jgi:hypothetical protein
MGVKLGLSLMAFENRVQRRVFGPNRDDLTEKWGKLHYEKLHILYSSPNIIRQIKSRRIRWVGYVACMGEREKCTGLWWERPKERDHLKDHGIDRTMGSEWILKILAGGGVEWIQLVQDRGGGRFL